jgi:hypothetical protein
MKPQTAVSKPELFHAIGDDGSAAARRLVVELGLEDRVRLRNVFYPEVSADLAARGGRDTPALWDGASLIEGAEPVLRALRALAGHRV